MEIGLPASRARHATARRLRHSGRVRLGMSPYAYRAQVSLYPPEYGGLNAEPPLQSGT